MLFSGIVKRHTADLMLLTKLKKISGMKETFVQNMEVPVSLMDVLLQTQGRMDVFGWMEGFGGLSCLKFYILRCFLGE